MKTKRTIFIAALVCIATFACLVLLMTIPALQHAAIGQCEKYGYSCYLATFKFWP